MRRLSEIHLITMILMFVVFAFLMQGRAHGAETYVVRGSTTPPTTGKYIVGRPKAEYGIQVLDLEQAYDLAYALNRAHEERTAGRALLQVPAFPYYKYAPVCDSDFGCKEK